jgi:tRNA(Leu) C34 or U34 (ribose-2'-O)-methylase TrmL
MSADSLHWMRGGRSWGWRHIPVIHCDLMDAIPQECDVVVVELCDRAKPLNTFHHPERAFYIFGPEDGSVPKEIIERAKHVVQVPTKHCMNLAATVNVVLYDRMAKQMKEAP